MYFRTGVGGTWVHIYLWISPIFVLLGARWKCTSPPPRESQKTRARPENSQVESHPPCTAAASAMGWLNQIVR